MAFAAQSTTSGKLPHVGSNPRSPRPREERSAVLPLSKTRERPSSARGRDTGGSTTRVASGNVMSGAQPDHALPFLGMHMRQGHTDNYGPSRSYDYTKKYPDDRKGKDLDPDARLWKVYLDEAEVHDVDMITGFRNTLDGTLVFAALFSSIITGFVIEASQKLEPDYGQIHASLLVESNLLLRAGGNMSRMNDIPPSTLGVDSVTHSMLDVWVNWMFLASLCQALVTALFSIVVKQWLQVFTTVIRGDAKEQCLIRQLRFSGLEKWKLSEIINALPIFLHVSLAFFFAGLGIFVRNSHLAIRIVVYAAASISSIFYFITVILPVMYPDCPYRLPVLHSLARFVVHGMKQARQLFRRGPLPPFSSSSFLSLERKHALKIEDQLKASCIAWLFSESTNTSVQNISIGAAGVFLQAHSRHRWNQYTLRNMPLPEMLSFVLNSTDSLAYPLEEMSPQVNFMSGWCHATPRNLPPDSWHVALRSPKLLKEFLSSGVPLDVEYFRGSLEAYPLQHACRLGLWNTVATLIPSVPRSHLAGFGSSQRTPLMLVCAAENIPEQERVSITKLLLEKAAHLGDVDYDGQTALHHACRSGCSWEIIDSLLSAATHSHLEIVNHRDEWSRSPLVLASQHCPPSSIGALLSADANANTADRYGRTPLHLVCGRIASFAKGDDFSVFEKLVHRTTEVNLVVRGLLRVSTWQDGETPLDELVRHRRETDAGTFRKAYMLLRAKDARCELEAALQAEIDAEFGVSKVSKKEEGDSNRMRGK